MTTTVTIGIPTYNRADLVLTAIQRLLAQDLANVEILVSDNASEDGTAARLAELHDPRLRVFIQQENLGPLGNFDFLLAQSQGEFFILHQDDDFLHGSFLSALAQAHRLAPDLEVFATSYWRGNPQKGYSSAIPAVLASRCDLPEGVAEPAILPGRDIAPAFLTGMPIINPGMAYRTATLRRLGGFDNGPIWGSDILLTVGMMMQGSFAYLPTPLAIFHEHNSNYARRISKRVRDEGYEQLYRSLIGLFDKAEVPWCEIVRNELVTMSSSQILGLLRRWTKSNSPRPLIALGWACYARMEKHTFRRLWRAGSRLGIPCLLRALRSSFQEDPCPRRSGK